MLNAKVLPFFRAASIHGNPLQENLSPCSGHGDGQLFRRVHPADKRILPGKRIGETADFFVTDTGALKDRIFSAAREGSGNGEALYALALCNILFQHDVAKSCFRCVEADALLLLHGRPSCNFVNRCGDGRAEFLFEQVAEFL